MHILGVDPGLRADNPAGWAAFDGDTSAVLACGVIAPPRGLAWEARVQWVGAALEEVAIRHAVSYVACEDAYLGASAQVFRQLIAFGWEMRTRAREWSCPFVLVNPADQALLLSPASRRAIPLPVLSAATGHLPERHRPHARSAIAVAWHGAGLLREMRIASERGAP